MRSPPIVVGTGDYFCGFPLPELAGGFGGVAWLFGAGGGVGGCLPPFFSNES